MAGVRWPPEDSDLFPSRPPPAATEMVSDDDRSVAADSWSIKSDYGSTLDDEQRHADAAEILSVSTFPAASDSSSDKEDSDTNEAEPSILGLQSYWDATYAEDLVNFHEHGHAGEIWFGVEVMDVVASWTKNLCTNMVGGGNLANGSSNKSKSKDEACGDLSKWSVLDIGTGNGLLLQELAKQGFSDLTGTDYSEGAINLAQNLVERDGFSSIKFLVDDVLDTKLDRKFQLIVDKGTFDAIGLHPDGLVKRMMYWEAVSNLVTAFGLLVITSCNNTKDELLAEVDDFNKRIRSKNLVQHPGTEPSDVFQYLDHVRTYPTVVFGGVEGSHVSTVAFIRK
ncbi:Protein-lysine N-methyltransferase Efm4/METTL10 protein [Dioscorea alata]|uniref:Protein-lysine N-methyltransferase Efm4/METTL10 protein n=1 Tax=Dioscorea alata TaxID=55571 RepID=A0ACB7W514_DIOAL|nr:Protein-lysine N-methyltransferase Efm4/METTL10 protein [Dioscorea alata]